MPFKDPERAREYLEAWKGRNFFRLVFHNAKNRAMKRGLAFDLTPEYLESIWADRCPVLGIKLTRGATNRAGSQRPPSLANLDRVDPERGYTQGNVAFLSFAANRMKADSTPAQLRAIADWIDAFTAAHSK